MHYLPTIAVTVVITAFSSHTIARPHGYGMPQCQTNAIRLFQRAVQLGEVSAGRDRFRVKSVAASVRQPGGVVCQPERSGCQKFVELRMHETA
jgi:hypothetical protein